MSHKILPLKIIATQIGEAHLESMLQTLDRLHDAAAARDLKTTCSADHAVVVGWLEDIIYTAQETIGELQRQSSHGEAVMENVSSLLAARRRRPG